jgi:hypothetical protein
MKLLGIKWENKITMERKPRFKNSFGVAGEEAKKADILISVAIDKAIIDAITAFEHLSEALKETLNKINK